MHYRIKFKAAPQEFVFEMMSCFVLARDVIKTVRTNFNLYKSELIVYNQRGDKLEETDDIENGRTYIIKRIPPPVVVRRRRKGYWYR